MEKEDILLGMELGRLEIEPIKFNHSRSNENPFIIFQKRNLYKATALSKEPKCTCLQRKGKHSGISKNKPYKILKEPVFKLLKKHNNNNILLEADDCEEASAKDIETACGPLNLCTLVDNCNQLTISSSSYEQTFEGMGLSNENRWWKTNGSHVQESRDQRQQSSASGSCSQQVLNPPCDVTIDELASYFETLVHIPKKMSSMAEMMYI